MPIFEYQCRHCGSKFEAILFGEQQPECPNCQAHELDQQLSTFAVSKSNPTPAPSAGCGRSNCCMMGDCSDN